jgi:hypothetical protein
MFMEYIHLSAIRCIVTFKFEKEELEFDISDPGKRKVKGMNLIEGLMNTVACISGSPL